MLYEWYFFQNLSKKWLKKHAIFFVAFVVLLGIIALIHLGADPWDKLRNLRDFSDGQFTIGQRLMTQSRVVMHYISLIILPHPSRLNLDYDFPLSYSLINPATTLLSSVAIAGLIILAIFLARNQRLISFCIFWFLGNLVIESSVIPLAIIFEHRIYLPSMLACLVPVILAYRCIQPKWLVAGGCCALILLHAFWTFERNNVWRDRLTLWADVVKKSPNKARPYTPLAAAQKKRGMMDDAFRNFQKALALDPNFVDAHHNMGVMLGERNEINEAIAHYRKALEIKPDHLESRNNLGVALLKQDKTQEAIDHLIKARRIDPNYAPTHYNLGVAHSRQSRIHEALESYANALKINPTDSNTHVKMGDALLMLGKPDQAVTYFKTALRLDPDNAEAYLYLGSQLLNQDKKKEALEYLNSALRINPELAQAHLNIGIIMIRKGNLETAISHFRQAAEIDPNFELAQTNLKKALAIQRSMGRKDAPIQKVPKENRNNPVWHYEMGNRYLSEGKLPLAIAEFESALALQPRFLAAQNNLALAYAANQQYEQALAAFKKLIELDPANAGAYYNIAVLYALQNNVPEAVDSLKQAVDKGYQNWRLIKNDKDLANIRDSEEYRACA